MLRLLVSQLCEMADIGPKLILDNSWFFSLFMLHPQQDGGYSWSMPKFLLHDEISKLTLESEIKQFF